MESRYYGIDVSKDSLDIAGDSLDIAGDGCVSKIENKRTAIGRLVRSMPVCSVVAMEATNSYHLAAADACFAAGMRVYVVNPRVTHHYREVMSLRGHNDRMDAQTILEFIRKEHGHLRPYVPKSSDVRRLEVLVRRRSKLVGVRVQLEQSMREVKEIKGAVEAVLDRLNQLVTRIELLIDKQLEGDQDRLRLLEIPSVGKVVSAAMICDLRSCSFGSADAFVAFYGLDPRPNESGKMRGRRKISKQGQRLGRTLLYNAAMSACTSRAWKPLYDRALEKGLSKVQALIVLARKIARCAWSIYTHKTSFSPSRICQALT